MIWAMVAVDLLHPLNTEIDHAGADYCAQAFSSVWSAFLLLFQTLVAGDSWGKCTLPIISTYPLAFVIFFGSLSTIVVCLANLIMAVIVERACEAKTSDFEHMMSMRIRDEDDFKGKMSCLCEDIPHQKDGAITLAELLVAYDENDDFHAELAKLDIEKDELRSIFKLGDTRSLGEVPFAKLIDDLYKVQSKDMRSLNLLIKYELSEIHRTMAEMAQKIDLQSASLSLSATESTQNWSMQDWPEATLKKSARRHMLTLGEHSHVIKGNSRENHVRETSSPACESSTPQLSQWEASKAAVDSLAASGFSSAALGSVLPRHQENFRSTAAGGVVGTIATFNATDMQDRSAAADVSPRFVPDSEHETFPRPSILPSSPLSCRNSPRLSPRGTPNLAAQQGSSL